MRSFRTDPYLWVHLAGLAAVPLWLDICLLGLAAGNPVLPAWMEIGLLSLIGILPILWMQWQKPFCIFSLMFLAVRPDRMSEDQRRILRLFRDPLLKFLAGLAPISLIWALWKLYGLAPLVAELTPFPNRWVGLLVAAIAFLLVNLFVQVPLSVVRVLLTPGRVFSKIPPYPSEQVKQDFTLLGLRVNRILPNWHAVDSETSPSSNGVTKTPNPVVATSQSSQEAWDDEEISLNPEGPSKDLIDQAVVAAPANEIGNEAVDEALEPATELDEVAATGAISAPPAIQKAGDGEEISLNPEGLSEELAGWAEASTTEVETLEISSPEDESVAKVPEIDSQQMTHKSAVAAAEAEGPAETEMEEQQADLSHSDILALEQSNLEESEPPLTETLDDSEPSLQP